MTEYCADGFHTVDEDEDGIFTYGGHVYSTVVTAPTCTEQGYTTYTCSCGDHYVADYTEATGHADENGDHWCDECGISMLKGDLDLDGDVDASDLTLLARHVGRIETLTGQALLNADVNGDGNVDSEDLTMHARYVAKIITTWEDEE